MLIAQYRIAGYFRGVLVRYVIRTYAHARLHVRIYVYALTWQFFPDTGGPYVLIDVVTSHTRSMLRVTGRRLPINIHKTACVHHQLK